MAAAPLGHVSRCSGPVGQNGPPSRDRRSPVVVTPPPKGVIADRPVVPPPMTGPSFTLSMSLEDAEGVPRPSEETLVDAVDRCPTSTWRTMRAVAPREVAEPAMFLP